MKAVLAIIFLFTGNLANADQVQCQYQSGACDQYGNHYACMSSFIGGFCSAADESRGPVPPSENQCPSPPTCPPGHYLHERGWAADGVIYFCT